MLGGRLETEMDGQLKDCYICSGNMEKFVGDGKYLYKCVVTIRLA